MTGELTLLPAVDVQGGRAVQLQQGVASSERAFGDHLDVAQKWQGLGGQWIHLVDLDAAVCLCGATRADVLGINVDISGSLDVILNECGKNAPAGFLC